MRRFGGGGTVDDEDAVRFHERFISTRPEDRHFDNRAYHDAATEYLGKLPDDQFREAARNAVAQAPPQEKAGLLGAILSAMSGSTAVERAQLPAAVDSAESRACSVSIPLIRTR